MLLPYAFQPITQWLLGAVGAVGLAGALYATCCYSAALANTFKFKAPPTEGERPRGAPERCARASSARRGCTGDLRPR